MQDFTAYVPLNCFLLSGRQWKGLYNTVTSENISRFCCDKRIERTYVKLVHK